MGRPLAQDGSVDLGILWALEARKKVLHPEFSHNTSAHEWELSHMTHPTVGEVGK